VLRAARREPSAVLLGAQLLGVVLYPAMEGNEVGRSLFSVFGIVILGLVVLAVRSSPGLTWVGVALGVPATVLLLIQAVTRDDALLAYSSALEAVLYFYAAYALIRYMLADHRITRDELWAVGATFTLVAWAFAYVFVVWQAIEPHSFTAAVEPHQERTWIELLFLSFTNLSSTGLSDVVPVKPFARSLVMLEQLAGLAYIAMLVSRLVGLLVMSRAQSARR
jgi:Ion channel